MDDLHIRGLAIMTAIALAVMLFALRGQPRAVWLFSLALVAAGLGYLATTPSPTEFAELIFGTATPTAVEGPVKAN